MARSIYVMPIIGTGTKLDPRRPKYAATYFTDHEWSMFDYGDEPWSLVGVSDITTANDTAMTAEPDVFRLPDNLDQGMGTVGARNTVRNRLEAVNIPGTWVQTTTTYREVVRFIGAVCQFAQRFQGITGIPGDRWFAGGRTLDSTFGSLGTAGQQALIDTADSFGFDHSSLTASTTLRTFLKSAGDQYVAAGLPLDLEGPL
jgi:hypothetical protein